MRYINILLIAWQSLKEINIAGPEKHGAKRLKGKEIIGKYYLPTKNKTSLLMSDKIDLKIKDVIGDKDRLHIMNNVKRTIKKNNSKLICPSNYNFKI